ncbi:MAG: hypothetical protein OXE99_07490 [Cellvibrionales bacterium]|nr:hypothetical protein [Cellvibrionales bacterium]
MRFVVLLLMAAFLTACTTTEKKSQLASFYLPASRAVVLPVTSQQSGLDALSQQLTASLKNDLAAHNYQVVAIDPEVYRHITESALNATGSVYHPKLKQSLPLEPASYLRAVVEGLKRYYGFDVIFQSSIELRDAEVKKGIALWDNAKFPLEIVDKPKTAPIPLKAKGVSLKVSAYTSLGGTIHQVYQGMVVPYKILYQGSSLGQTQLTPASSWPIDAKTIAKESLKSYYPKVKIAPQ